VFCLGNLPNTSSYRQYSCTTVVEAICKIFKSVLQICTSEHTREMFCDCVQLYLTSGGEVQLQCNCRNVCFFIYLYKSFIVGFLDSVPGPELRIHFSKIDLATDFALLFGMVPTQILS